MDVTRFKGLPDWAKGQDPRSHCYSSYTDRSIERLQLDEAVETNAETVGYLYVDFTPRTVTYPRGTRPLLEMIVDRVCRNRCVSSRSVGRASRLRRLGQRLRRARPCGAAIGGQINAL